MRHSYILTFFLDSGNSWLHSSKHRATNSLARNRFDLPIAASVDRADKRGTSGRLDARAGTIGRVTEEKKRGEEKEEKRKRESIAA